MIRFDATLPFSCLFSASVQRLLLYWTRRFGKILQALGTFLPSLTKGIQPELHGQIVPFHWSGDVGPNFFSISGSQRLEIDRSCLYKKLCVFRINVEIPCELAQDEVARIEHPELQMLEVALENRRQPIRVQVR